MIDKNLLNFFVNSVVQLFSSMMYGMRVSGWYT